MIVTSSPTSPSSKFIPKSLRLIVKRVSPPPRISPNTPLPSPPFLKSTVRRYQLAGLTPLRQAARHRLHDWHRRQQVVVRQLQPDGSDPHRSVPDDLCRRDR